MKNKAQDLFEYIHFEEILNGKEKAFPNLVGFYESREMGRNIDLSIKIFMEYFSNKYSGCELYTTATDFPGRAWSKKQMESARVLEKKGWFKFDRDEEDIVNDFTRSSLVDSDINSLGLLFELVLEGMVDGYVFLFWRSEKLVVYPHKYEGFGFIADKNTSGINIAKDFLEFLQKKSKEFVVECRQ